jgi:uncharacterized protein (TIGR00369 family)
VEDATQALLAAMPFGAVLGMEVVSASPELVELAMPFRDELCTAGGILHGGALMGLADAGGGFLAFLNLPDGAAGTATIESKTNFFRAVRGGRVLARSQVLHQGRTTIVVETDLFDDEARRVARVTQTQAILGAPS